MRQEDHKFKAAYATLILKNYRIKDRNIRTDMKLKEFENISGTSNSYCYH